METNIKFDNLALKTLPIDTVEDNYVRTVPNACFSKVKPTPVKSPKLVACSVDALKLIGINEENMKHKRELAEIFSGNVLLPGSDPAAHCYCGHQFGYFSGQLGDGAAIYLGEVINDKQERWELQLKGAGKTPYSRSADGRKVLRSSIREFLCSEAIYYLGIPTTRAGTCVTSDDYVVRDIFYDGHPINERCTIISRIAQTFIRFGSFEIFKTIDPLTNRQGPSVGRKDILIQLTEYVISTFYPDIAEKYSNKIEEKYLAFFEEIVLRTARLVAEWQCVGWCHGVLNTDNMSIIGVTIDYGPYGFLDRYDPKFICNGSDSNGRYSYKQQPIVCRWNCEKLAEALSPIMSVEKAKQILQKFDIEYEKYYLDKMRRKLGLVQKQLDSDKELIDQFLSTMYETGGDFTNSFRTLSLLHLPGTIHFDKKVEIFKTNILQQCCNLDEWKFINKPDIDNRTLQMLSELAEQNDMFLQQFGFSAERIQVEKMKYEKLKNIEQLSSDQKRDADWKQWEKWLDLYLIRLEKEIDSNDTNDIDRLNKQRLKIMRENNPRIVLRNYLAQRAIESAEKGDYSEVRNLLEELKHPYDGTDKDEIDLQKPDERIQGGEQAQAATDPTEKCYTGACLKPNIYESRPPINASRIRVTCSS